MGTGEEFVNTLRKIIVINHTRLHQAHQACPICQNGPFLTIESMMDHVDQHSERVHARVYSKDDAWILLCAPSDYYQSNRIRVPATLRHLRSLPEQERTHGVEPEIGHDKLEYTGLPSLRRLN